MDEKPRRPTKADRIRQYYASMPTCERCSRRAWGADDTAAGEPSDDGGWICAQCLTPGERSDVEDQIAEIMALDDGSTER